MKNFYLTHEYVTRMIDKYRDEKLQLTKKFYIKKIKKSLRILHITNFNERLDGRLFFNTGRRINNGFIRQGHSVLGFSDRDIQKYYKSFNDLKGAKTLNDKLIIDVDPQIKVNFTNGKFVKFLEPLTDGPISPHDKLETLFNYYQRTNPVHIACKKSFKYIQLFLVIIKMVLSHTIKHLNMFI